MYIEMGNVRGGWGTKRVPSGSSRPCSKQYRFLGEEEVNKWLSVSVDGNSSKTIEPKREKSVDFVVVVVVVAEIFKF